MSTAVAAGAVALLTLAPSANAYPAGPWGVEGNCKGKSPAECAWVPDPDGLVWRSYLNGREYTANYYDKTGGAVCTIQLGAPSSGTYCEAMLALIRALPPVRIGH